MARALHQDAMTETGAPFDGPRSDEGGMTLMALGSILLQGRRTIIVLGLAGAVLGLVSGLLSPRRYKSSAMFIPQGAEGGASGIALAASQFGIRLPAAGGGGWGPPVYVELMHSPSLLEPIARESVTVVEEGGRRVPIADLLKVNAASPQERLELTVRSLQQIAAASEVKSLGAVRVAVTSRWPSVSFALANRLLAGVNRFNLDTRKSQASAERQFVEAQATEAGLALRRAEDELQIFLQRNRNVSGSPALSFERDRLQREVGRRQEVYTSLLQSREEAKIREVRQLPVITILEEPRLPVTGEARQTVMRILTGGFAAGMLGVLIALVAHAMRGARAAADPDAREFFALVGQITPRFLRRVKGGAR